MPRTALLALFYIFIPLITLFAQQSGGVGIRKVVIDAGHGGKDPGTISIGGRVKEKNITLSVALELGKLIESHFPEIEVIYTRKSDIYLMLDKRSEIANKSKADLFISIHVNGARSVSASGSETFVMGSDNSKSNLEVTMLENSVILLEGEDYRTKYNGFNPNDPESYIIFSLLQNAHIEQSLQMASYVQNEFSKGPIVINRGVKQAPFLVLWKTSMPSVLVELGFITNQRDLKVLSDKKSHQKFAQHLFKAFQSYQNHYYKNSTQQSVDRAATDRTIYTVQILSISRPLNRSSKELKGVDEPGVIKRDGLYKYVTGKFSSLEEAKRWQSQIVVKFPGAFVIKIKEKQIESIK